MGFLVGLDQLSLAATADGSFTFFSATFQEHFHSNFGAKQEAEQKFILPALSPLPPSRPICLIDFCYGLGYNTAAALEYLAPERQVCLIGLENNLEVPQTAVRDRLISIWQPPTQQILSQLAHHQTYQTEQHDLQLLIGDARQTIQQVPLAWADAIFFDPFSPKRCPQLWTIDLLSLVSDRLKPQGYLVTYSCAAAVRSALHTLGLHFWATQPLGRKAPGTIASWQNDAIPNRSQALSELEQEILTTRAGIPYRDPQLQDPAAVIVQRRQAEQATSKLRSTSNWLKQHLSGKCDP
ncbi:MAG: MnmC family methyltransferase [Pseudanabaenaceae cyanobacterium bins.68]|nr:MnmC family methyltransferase [Pseudanabaenaceae cyanobacterium bins.68]